MSVYEGSNLQTDALTVGQALKLFLDRLGDKEVTVTVHSVFDNVINLSSDEGIISLVFTKVGYASSYIAVSEKNIGKFTDIQMKSGAKCIISRKRLDIDHKLIVRLDKAGIWKNSISKNFSWDVNQLQSENLLAFYNTLQRHAAAGSAFSRIQNNDEAFINRVSFLKDKKLLGSPSTYINKLIGYGPGLTPTGDDLLLGFSLVASSCREYSEVIDKFKDSLLSILHLTTGFSGDVLSKGIRGEYHETLENLLLAMLFQSPESVMIASKKLLSIGATSGTDIATGIYLGIINA